MAIDDRLATGRMNIGVSQRLRSFHTYPSWDGRTLFSMTVPDEGRPFYMEASRNQVTAALHELNTAAYMMAQRSGTRADPIVAQNWVLRPDVENTLCRYNSRARMLNVAWCFDDRLPLPMSISLEAYLLLRERCDAVCGLIGTIIG